MGEPYFIYNGINSKDMGILVNELPPITRAAKTINKLTIPGRDGFLTEDLGTYEGVVKPCKCTVLDNSRIDDILTWLDGSGDVIFSNQPDRKYKGSIINQIPLERIIQQWLKFVVIFDCQPSAYSLANDVVTLQATPAVVTNPATKESRPLIKVYGTGVIDLTVNSKTIHLSNVVDYVTIDSNLMDCYKDTTLKNGDMSGDFPILQVGNNDISWVGTVTKVEITPNWRYL